MTSGGCFFLLNFGWRRFIKGFLTTNHLFNASPSPSLLGVTVLLKFSRRQEKTGLGHPDRRVISSETSADLVLIDSWPIGSMHGIYANIGGILMVNVTIYSSTMDPSWERVSNCDQMYHSIIGILNGTPHEARKGTRRQFCGLNPRKVMVVIAGSNMFFCFSQLQLP